jgi:predicted membrane-bound spermidine synthase
LTAGAEAFMDEAPPSAGRSRDLTLQPTAAEASGRVEDDRPAAGLFVRDFYTAVIRALRPGGVMTAQTESPHRNADLVAAIYREIHASFRYGDAYACWLPTYPSGCWTLAYASPDRRHDDFFDDHAAFEIESRCRYYNRALQQGAFALPTFARDAVYGGVDPFERYTAAQRELLGRGGEPKES